MRIKNIERVNFSKGTQFTFFNKGKQYKGTIENDASLNAIYGALRNGDYISFKGTPTYIPPKYSSVKCRQYVVIDNGNLILRVTKTYNTNNIPMFSGRGIYYKDENGNYGSYSGFFRTEATAFNNQSMYKIEHILKNKKELAQYIFLDVL